MAQSSIPSENTAKVKKFDFVYCFRPVYYFSRMFGYMPFTIIFDSNGSIKGSKIRVLDISWFILSVFLYILSTFMHFRNIEYPKNTSFVLIGGDFLLLKLSLLFSILNVVMDMCNRFKLVDILKNFNSFDEKVGHVQVKNNIKYGSEDRC